MVYIIESQICDKQAVRAVAHWNKSNHQDYIFKFKELKTLAIKNCLIKLGYVHIA